MIKRITWIVTLLLVLAAQSQAREPAPFTDAYQDGYILTLWNDNYPDSRLITILDRLKTGGERHLTLPVFGCQPSTTSSEVGACTMRHPEFLLHVARLAQQQGMNVSLLPIVQTPKYEWRGFFEPDNVDRWFETYTAWIRGIAREARSMGMNELVVGSEFVKLYKHTEKWKQVLRAVREEFPGPLIVTMNWDSLNASFWDEADAIGVSAYPPISKSNNPSQEVLDEGWKKHRATWLGIAAKWKRPLHITEVGYHSSTDAARTPWGASSSAKYDAELQARCFEAFRRTWAQEKSVVRASVWSVEDPANIHGITFDPIGKPAQSVLESFFNMRSGL